MASQITLILSHPPNRTTLSFHTLPKPTRIRTLSLSRPESKFFPSSSIAGSTRTVTALSLFPSFALTGSTRTVTAPSPSKLFPFSSLTGSTRTITAHSPSKISPLSLLKPNNTLSTAVAPGPLFFAPISDGSAPGAQIAVIVAGLARRCIEIYTRVLVIRLLLSLYPNMEWDKQPMSAIRDLCDPFLGLFRGIIPPLFNSVDVRPILAFLLLGMLWLFAKSLAISL